MAIYASDRYSSMDLDFIDRLHTTRRQIKAALAEIGFSEKARYFVHPDTPFFLEFPSGPLAVGGEPVTEVEELRLETGTLSVVVADRLYQRPVACVLPLERLAMPSTVGMGGFGKAGRLGRDRKVVAAGKIY